MGVIRTIISNKTANLKLTLYIHDFLDINREVWDWVGGCEDYDLDGSGMSEETVLQRQPAVGRRFHSARCTGERSGRGKKLTNQLGKQATRFTDTGAGCHKRAERDTHAYYDGWLAPPRTPGVDGGGAAQHEDWRQFSSTVGGRQTRVTTIPTPSLHDSAFPSPPLTSPDFRVAC